MSTSALKTSYYPAKEEFDQFVASLPANTENLSFSQKSDLSLKAWELLDKGLPYSDRPIGLYYFYHFLALRGESEQDEVPPQLVDAVSYSLAEKDISEYLSLLDKDKLYEVSQIRGELQTFALRLDEFVINEELFGEWESIKKASEEFLMNEPGLPLPFLETYMRAYNHYCYKAKRPDARLYEIAKQVLDLSTDLKYAIPHADGIVNDEENLRVYQKETLPPEDAKKILALEELQEYVEAEFGGDLRVRSTLGKAVNFLTKEGREQRKLEKEVQAEWCGRIRRTGRSRSPYVHGFSEFLCSFVYMGTDDVKKAIKSLEDSYNAGFDRGVVAALLSHIHDGLKNKTEAARFAQIALDFLHIESIEEAKELKWNDLILTIKAAGQEPQFVTRLWKAIQEKNFQKREEIINALEPKIQKARKENLEQRTKIGIEFLDSLIPLTQTDEALIQGKKFSEIMIDTHSADLLVLSLEEIDLFGKTGLDQLLSFYNPAISVQAAIEYIDNLMKEKYGNIAMQIGACMESFPNLMATIPIVKKYIAQFVQNGNQDSALKLTEFAIEKRPSVKAPSFYDAIRPLQKSLHEKQQWLDEIALISKARKILQEKEFSEATTDLTEAYVAALNIEKSLNQKDKLLKDAESENLSDERLKNIRVEVDALLNRRKKIIIWSAVAVGALIVIAIIIAILFK